MITRTDLLKLHRALAEQPAVAIIGPRQIGKTTLAREVSAFPGPPLYLDLKSEADRAKLQSAELYLAAHSDRLVIIDEIQRDPELFPLLRSLIDRDRRNGRFLLLGSASPVLLKRSSESLAGRIRYLELSGFTLSEIGAQNWRSRLIRGGFPLSFLATDNESSFRWRIDFIRTFLESDLPQLGLRLSAPLLRRFWTMTAHRNAQLWNASTLASSLGISAPTVSSYLDLLEHTFVLRRLPPYLPNLGKRLVKAPKVYFRDTGLAQGLLGIRNFEDLLGHPSLGALWENLIVEEVLTHPSRQGEGFFYRTSSGAELDLVLVKSGGRIDAVEIKFGLAPQVSRGFRQGMNDIGAQAGWILYSGEESYPIDTNIQALGIQDWGRVWE